MGSIQFKQLSELEYRSVLIPMFQNQSLSTLKEEIAKQLGKDPSLLNIIVKDTTMLEGDVDITDYNSFEVLVNRETRRIPSKYATDDPCVADPVYADDPRVKMPCGHAITQDNLYHYCAAEIKSGKSQILCISCKRPWDFFDIIERADLSSDEQIFLNRILNNNIISDRTTVKQCPECQTYAERISPDNNRVECSICKKAGKHPFEFCWKCNGLWNGNHVCPKDREQIRNILQNCKLVTMSHSNIPNVPSTRLCPKCQALLEHTGGCKTMTCKCGYVFCFCCLKSKDGKGLGCNSLNEKCQIAPIQAV